MFLGRSKDDTAPEPGTTFEAPVDDVLDFDEEPQF